MPRGLVDLRSDTVTRPTDEMRRAMAEAEVGDDGFGEDPTVNRLEEAFCERVGKAAAVFVPSGVMANQIALRVLAQPGTAVVAGRHQHVVAYELGAAAKNAGVQFHAVDDADGTFGSRDVIAARLGADHHQPVVSMVCVENTHMASGGRPWPLANLEEVRAAAAGLAVHMDGARLFNAEVATGVRAATMADTSLSVSCCLSKGLCAPVGSLLAGPADMVAEGRVERKRLGGAMRQAGILAAAGLIALASMVDRLAEDHVRARRLAEAVAEPVARRRTGPGRRAHQYGRLRVPGRREGARAPAPGGCAGRGDRPGCFAWSPTATSTTTGWSGPGAPCSLRRRDAVGGTALKVRIGVGTGAAGLDGPALSVLADGLGELGFDSLWLPEVLTAPGVDPIVGLSWVGAHHPRLKLGTTMLLPGRHPVRLARQLASLDSLSGGRLLVTFVPGLARGAERGAVGVPVAERGPAVEEVLPVLRRLWAGERVSHDGPSGSFTDVSISPLPVQDPLEIWLGGYCAHVARALRTAGRRLASRHVHARRGGGRPSGGGGRRGPGRAIGERRALRGEHRLLDGTAQCAGGRGALGPDPGRPLADLVPESVTALRELLGRYLDVGFSKFVLRPLMPPDDWRGELDRLAAAVGDLQN